MGDQDLASTDACSSEIAAAPKALLLPTAKTNIKGKVGEAQGGRVRGGGAG